jgi:hypothetical protein
MEKIESDWTFVWDKTFKNFRVMNKLDGSSLEIHLQNIIGKISNTPDFNMSIFPRRIVRKKMGLIKVDTLKFVPPHQAARWESHKVSESISNGIVSRGGVGTSYNKPLEAASFRGMKRNRFSKTNVPISKC